MNFGARIAHTRNKHENSKYTGDNIKSSIYIPWISPLCYIPSCFDENLENNTRFFPILLYTNFFTLLHNDDRNNRQNNNVTHNNKNYFRLQHKWLQLADSAILRKKYVRWLQKLHLPKMILLKKTSNTI